MSNYAILRINPVKRTAGSRGGVRGLAAHHLRENVPPNANGARAPRPMTAKGYAQTSAEVMQRIDEAVAAHDATGRALQKNSPTAIDIFIGMSKSRGRKADDKYFQDALRWIEDKYGKENILLAAIHRDETTPHMQALVMPRIKGRFQASKVLGDRNDFTRMQDDFFEKVGSRHDLARGLRGSKAKHVNIRRFYAALNRDPNLPQPKPVPPSPGFLDRILRPAAAKRLATRRADAIAHNAARTRRIGELAGVGARVHPEIIRRGADMYRATLEERQALENRVTRAQAQARIAEQDAAAGKATLADVTAAANRVTAASLRLLPQPQVDRIAAFLGPGVELRAGRDLVDQLRKAGKCATLADGLERIEAAIKAMADADAAPGHRHHQHPAPRHR